MSNPEFTTSTVNGTEYLKVELDISTFSGDLGSVVSLNYTTNAGEVPQGSSNLFEVFQGYWSLVVQLDCIDCSLGISGLFNMDLSSHYSSIIYGPGMDSGVTLYLDVYVFDPLQGNSTNSFVYKRFDLGVIP